MSARKAAGLTGQGRPATVRVGMDRDRYRIDRAREELAKAAELDLSDDRAMARTIGRLEVALQQLLEMFDEDGVS